MLVEDSLVVAIVDYVVVDSRDKEERKKFGLARC